MSGRIGQKLRGAFEARRPLLSGRVTAVGLDASGRPLGYVVCDVGGNSIKVNTAPGTNFQPGDWLHAEQTGGAASATYTAVGFTSGPRGNALMFEVPAEVTIGDETYEQGDLLLGDPFGKHWWYDLDQARFVIRDGAITQGALGNLQGLYDYAGVVYGSAFGRPTANWIGIDELNGVRIMRGKIALAHWRDREITLGEAGQPQLRLGPTAIDFLSATGTVQASLDGETRTIYGFERWGRPLGPALEIGPTDDGRWALWVRGENNVPFAALLSGTAARPNDVYFRLGAQGAASYLDFDAGELDISGKITARSGNIGGWSIEASRITAGRAYLQSAGALNLYGGSTNKWVLLDASHATVPLAVGHATATSAPFRVDWSGNLTATSVTLLQGAAAVGSGNYLIDVEGTGSGANGVKGKGSTVGVYGYGAIKGVQGYASGGTGAAGVFGEAGGGYSGVHGKGDPGVMAEAYGSGAEALRLVNGPMNANSQNIESVNRIYFDSTHYLYKSGDDIYWYNGSTGTKLN